MYYLIYYIYIKSLLIADAVIIN